MPTCQGQNNIASEKYKGENGWETRKRLQLKVPYDCNEKVVREATIRALGLIHANAIGLMMGPMPDFMDWTMPDMTTSCNDAGHDNFMQTEWCEHQWRCEDQWMQWTDMATYEDAC